MNVLDNLISLQKDATVLLEGAESAIFWADAYFFNSHFSIIVVSYTNDLFIGYHQYKHIFFLMV